MGKIGRPLGSPNVITPEMRQSFLTVFAMNGGDQGLYDWSNLNNDNKRSFYLMCVKLAPKEIKTEDMNRTHEQFIELMQMEKQNQLETKGQPIGLIEVSPEDKKTLKIT